MNCKDCLYQRIDSKCDLPRCPYNSDFGELYAEFEAKYNPYPVQMSRSEAFRHALEDGLIDEILFNRAREYYGKLWNYVGD